MDRFALEQTLNAAYPTLSNKPVHGESRHVRKAWSQLPQEAART